MKSTVTNLYLSARNALLIEWKSGNTEYSLWCP